MHLRSPVSRRGRTSISKKGGPVPRGFVKTQGNSTDRLDSLDDHIDEEYNPRVHGIDQIEPLSNEILYFRENNSREKKIFIILIIFRIIHTFFLSYITTYRDIDTCILVFLKNNFATYSSINLKIFAKTKDILYFIHVELIYISKLGPNKRLLYELFIYKIHLIETVQVLG